MQRKLNELLKYLSGQNRPQTSAEIANALSILYILSFCHFISFYIIISPPVNRNTSKHQIHLTFVFLHFIMQEVNLLTTQRSYL